MAIDTVQPPSSALNWAQNLPAEAGPAPQKTLPMNFSIGTTADGSTVRYTPNTLIAVAENGDQLTLTNQLNYEFTHNGVSLASLADGVVAVTQGNNRVAIEPDNSLIVQQGNTPPILLGNLNNPAFVAQAPQRLVSSGLLSPDACADLLQLQQTPGHALGQLREIQADFGKTTFARFYQRQEDISAGYIAPPNAASANAPSTMVSVAA